MCGGKLAIGPICLLAAESIAVKGHAKDESFARHPTRQPQVEIASRHRIAAMLGARFAPTRPDRVIGHDVDEVRSEEHTSELQSLMRISYAVFCLKKKNST